MASVSEMRPAILFGPFELNPNTGELRKQGIRLRLQPKPLQILYTLLEKPGMVVTREELKARLWPVGTSSSIATAIRWTTTKMVSTGC